MYDTEGKTFILSVVVNIKKELIYLNMKKVSGKEIEVEISNHSIIIISKRTLSFRSLGFYTLIHTHRKI